MAPIFRRASTCCKSTPLAHSRPSRRGGSKAATLLPFRNDNVDDSVHTPMFLSFCRLTGIAASPSARSLDLHAALALRGLLTLHAACAEALFPAAATLNPSHGNSCRLKPIR